MAFQAIALRNEILRGLLAAIAALAISAVAFLLFAILPIRLMGLIAPWELRSANDEMSALTAVAVVGMLCAAAMFALIRIIYRRRSP